MAQVTQGAILIHQSRQQPMMMYIDKDMYKAVT